MNPQKYQSVREEIIKAVPEIMELGFGCEIRCEGKTYRIINIGTYENSKEKWMNVLDDKGEIADGDFLTLNNSEIIGKEPGIAEVLRSISDLPIHIDGSGQFLNYGEDSDDFYPKYNLSKDRLSDQSPEVIDFLFEILCKNQ